MGKRKKRDGFLVPFTGIENRLLDSPEWKKKLTPKTKEIYILIRRKYKGDNADEINFTYKEAKANYDISQPTLRKAIRTLAETKIIIIVKTGGLYHIPSVYSLRGKFWGIYDKKPVPVPEGK